ncbi:hypothetical protein HPP92_005833 [Vanilla planifolia]|uniref:Calcium-dependent protein kinase n=1 Tax=Vanilla planifolia TaxID=51239 RepID=A0A835RNF3_VANPL|nr:hypothetical protein HPP92_005833 [Vanilla planifolia]
MLRTAVDGEDGRREVDIMRNMPHPNVVNPKHTYEDDNAVHLVMEPVRGVNDRIVGEDITLRGRPLLSQRPSSRLQVCHKHGVMHRDLSLRILFTITKETAASKLLILASLFSPGQCFTRLFGSPYYMALEVLKRNYGPEIDVWSAGVMLYILLCGVPPFWAVSESAKDLVKKMLDPDSKRRLSAQQVLDRSSLATECQESTQQIWVRLFEPDFNTVMNKFKNRPQGKIPIHGNARLMLMVMELWSMENLLYLFTQEGNDEHLREAFAYLIKNHSGYIEIEELSNTLQDDLGPNHEEVYQR